MRLEMHIEPGPPWSDQLSTWSGDAIHSATLWQHFLLCKLRQILPLGWRQAPTSYQQANC